MNIEGRSALVTGANRGIGQQLVRALLDAGAARVYAAARDPATLGETLAWDQARVTPLRLDVRSTTDVASAARMASDVTLVFNNAAVLEFAPATLATRAAMDEHFSVNVHGLLAVSQRFAATMERHGGGALVNILSLLSLRPEPSMAAYSASKAAAWSLTQSLRVQLRAQQITVHAVFPGPVDTDMLAMLPIRKASPAEVAVAIVAGVRAGHDDIYPDEESRRWFAQTPAVQ